MRTATENGDGDLCRIGVEYDGRAFSGWQIQTNAPSVQAALEDALLRLTGTSVRVRGAGRTDAGVHARGQTAAFPFPEKIPLENIPAALNSRLPDAVAVTSASRVPAGFDPRRDCVMKQYSYSYSVGSVRPALASGRCWAVRGPLDVAAMRSAAAFFTGTHDFTSFCNGELAGRDNVRTVERSEIVELPPDHAGRARLVYYVEGRSFLYNQVRAMAGTLAGVGAGRFRPDAIPAMLAAGRRSAAGMGAPPWGLCLEWTAYPGEEKPADGAGGLA